MLGWELRYVLMLLPIPCWNLLLVRLVLEQAP